MGESGALGAWGASGAWGRSDVFGMSEASGSELSDPRSLAWAFSNPVTGCVAVGPGLRKPSMQRSFPAGSKSVNESVNVVYPALALPLWSFTLLVALSRVVLGLHYPSDVAIGAAIGALTAMFVLFVV